MNATADALVIGAGVIGNAIAYHLAQEGRRVLVLERTAVAAEPSASWASAGGLRRQGRHSVEMALAAEATARWPTLAGELGVDLGYRRSGNLFVAETAAATERLVAFVARQHARGLTDVRLVEGEELRTLAPALAAHVVAGSYSPEDGLIDPVRTTRAFADAARRHRAVYWVGTAAEALLVHRERAIGARTARGDVSSDHVVLAAGAWSDELALGAGLRLPIRTVAYQSLRSTPAPPGLLGPVVSALGRRVSLKQLADGSFLLGGGWLGDVVPGRLTYRMRDASIAGNWDAAAGLVPAVAVQRVARAWCGLEAESIDGLPFVGSAPGCERLVVAAGFSGHGLALAPAIGRAVADLVAGRACPQLGGLGLGRIAAMAPCDVEAFVAGGPAGAALER